MKDTLMRYPNFTRVEFEDGHLIGERRILFPERLDEAATTWLHTRFWQLAEKGDIRVAERFSASFVENAAIVGRRAKVHCEIDLDLPQTDDSTWHQISAALSQGKVPEIDSSPRRCDPCLSIKLLEHVSIPELFLLNWEACLPPFSEADRALQKAAEKLDVPAMRAALKAGANPNCFERKYHRTPLGNVVEETARNVSDEEYSEAVAEQKDILALDAVDLLIEAGAAVDLAGYNEATPLASACLNSSAKLITKLLEHGADPTISCHNDDRLGAEGTAWDFASYRCDPNIDNDDDTAWDALAEFHPQPFEGAWIGTSTNEP
jgi:hypothetical protein